MLTIEFMTHVLVKTNGCWIWIGDQIKGLGIYRTPEGIIVSPHRCTYEHHFKVKLTKKDIIQRTCKSKFCICPLHLTKTTFLEMAKNRNTNYSYMQGEKHHKSKLTNDKVRFIRYSKLTYTELSIMLNVSVSTIYMVKSRRLWKHVK